VICDAALVELSERSSRPIPRETYRTLEDSADFLSLIEAGIVSLVRGARQGYGLKAGPYVGEALLDCGLRIRISEKAEGSLASLVRWALPADVRIADAPALVAPEGSVLQVFVHRFLDHLGGYIREGRLKEYSEEPRLSASPRGRIDVGETMRARARGQAGLVAHVRPQLTADLLVNQLLARALIAVDAFASARGDRVIRTRARGFSTLFEDVSAHRFERMPPDRLRQALQSALCDPRMVGELRDALAYAQALLLSWGAWPNDSAGVVPQSYFLKLETLFEEAVRSILEARLEDPVVEGTYLKKFVFVEHDAYEVNPDLVIGAPAAPTLVGDCKYKDAASGPGHSDVYQLLIHTESCDGRRALLIYPGSNARTTYVGASASGIDLWWSEVRLPYLSEDLLSTAQALGLPTQAVDGHKPRPRQTEETLSGKT
jgi:hypothetical protein